MIEMKQTTVFGSEPLPAPSGQRGMNSVGVSREQLNYASQVASLLLLVFRRRPDIVREIRCEIEKIRKERGGP